MLTMPLGILLLLVIMLVCLSLVVRPVRLKHDYNRVLEEYERGEITLWEDEEPCDDETC